MNFLFNYDPELVACLAGACLPNGAFLYMVR